MAIHEKRLRLLWLRIIGPTRSGEMTDYTINIDVADPGNLAGYYLTAFKGVGTSASNGQPTTWFTNGAPASKISVNWSESYQAYNADVEIIPNGTIKTSNPLNVDLGDQYASDQAAFQL
jgi:hypothetical protein